MAEYRQSQAADGEAMHATRPMLVLMIAVVLLCALACSSEQEPVRDETALPANEKQQFFMFSGGPTGGTFNFFANKMASLISSTHGHIDMSAQGAGGSVDNLRALNRKAVDLAIVYAGDAFLGRNGRLPGDESRYDQVRCLSFLYGAPAQLVVRRDSGINSVQGLRGKRVAIGNPGSGAAESAERFFRHLGLWDEMEPLSQGYSQAAANLIEGKIDGFWALVGYPNASVIAAATNRDVVLLGIHAEAMASGYYEDYPFYSRAVIPAATYPGQDLEVETFQDAALWCVNERMAQENVYDILGAVYGEAGLREMVAAHRAARDMAVSTGISGVSIPLHPGAVRFWRDKGVDVPAVLVQ